MSEEKSTDSEVDGALNEAKSLRNKVANRVTRAHSGKRDPRNGKPIDGRGESGFRGIVYTPRKIEEMVILLKMEVLLFIIIQMKFGV